MENRKCATMALVFTITCVLLGAMIGVATAFDPKTKKPLIDMVRENPGAIPLEERDPSLDPRKLFRDPNNNPKREPGPINIQSLTCQLTINWFKYIQW